MADQITYSLDSLPDGAWCRSVSAEPGVHDGRPGLRVALTEEIRTHGTPRVDYVDQPTFVVIPMELAAGRVEVDIAGDLLPDAPEWARGFVGVAFAIAPDVSTFECVYVRPTNGLYVGADEALRRQRAVQYFAYPDWPFDVLREQRPDEGFEAGADIAPGRWLHLVVEFDAASVRAEIDGVEVIHRARIGTPLPGALGMFVDIGTDAHFANLVVTPA